MPLGGRAVGNQALQRALIDAGSTPAPRSLIEREARAVAHTAIRMPAPAGSPRLTPVSPTAPSDLSLGRGQPLTSSVRSFFEPRFGRDFGAVRTYSGIPAAKSAEAFGAKAYTIGSNIVFADGHYAPGTAVGQRLIAHELAHVVQQAGGSARDGYLPIHERAAPGVVHREAAETESEASVPEEVKVALSGLPDWTALSWKPEDDYVLLIHSGQRLFVLPSTGLLYRPTPPEGAPKTPSDPWYGVPAVGKEGRGLVRTSSGVGVWLDVGGAPAALLPQALAELRIRMGVASIERVIPLHIHADHERDLIAEIKRSKLSASQVVIAGAWLRGKTGPLVKDVNALRGTKDPDLVTRGFGPQWQPAHPSVTPLPKSGAFRIPVTFAESNVAMELIGTGEAFAAYEQAHQAGEPRAPLTDAASFLAIVTNPAAKYDIAVVNDLRGADILRLRDALETAAPGSFAAAFARVRVMHGFQHHLGAVNSPDDVRGIIELLNVTLMQSGELTVVVQTRKGFMNEELAAALRSAGVRVVAALEPVGPVFGTAIARTSGRVATRGAGIEDVRGERIAREANQRLAGLRELVGVLERDGDLLSYETSREQATQELRAQRNALESLLKERNRALFEPLIPEARRPATAQPLRALADINVAIDQTLQIQSYSAHDLELARGVAKNAADLRALNQELARLKGEGEASVELYKLVARLDPRVAESLMFDSQGRPFPERLVRRSLAAQAQLEELGREGPAIAGGVPSRLFTGVLLVVTIVNEVGPVVEATRRTHLQENVLRFLQIAEWWGQLGVKPLLGAAVDPVFGEATLLTGTDKQEEIWNRVAKKVWGQIPVDQRVPEEKLPKDVREAAEVDDLWIESIPSINWIPFGLWITAHVRNYDEYAARFVDSKPQGIRRRGDDFATSEWDILLATFETSGYNRIEDHWYHDETFSKIMRATARRVIAGTEAAIGRTWQRRVTEPPPPEPTAIRAPEETVRAVSPIEGMRPTRRARFKADRTHEVFGVYDQDRIIGPRDWWAPSPFFIVFEYEPAPEGYLAVSGADYNTYGAIRSAATFMRDLTEIVQIRSPLRDPGDVLARTENIFSDIPREEDLSDRERRAIRDWRSNPTNVRFIRYDAGPSNPYMGEIQYYWARTGPNVRVTALARKDDLEFVTK